MKNITLACLSLFFFCSPILSDQLQHASYVTQMTQNDGDTVATSQVNVSSSIPTLILPSATGTLTGANRTNRRRLITNCGSYVVYIGSNAVAGSASTSTLTSVGYRLSESTGIAPSFSTYNTAAIYGTVIAGTPAGTVCTETESNSVQ